jgi:ADP-ribosylglycohydrolase
VTPTSEDRYAGCLLGLALGDAIGAPYEGGPLSGFLWQLIGAGERGKLRWTDDTQMSLVLCEHLIARPEPDVDALAREWADAMEWLRGYGPGSRRLLARVASGEDWRAVNRSIWPEGSFGNGAAMRAAPLGLRWPMDRAARNRWVDETSRVTHAHPLGIAGARLVADAAARALRFHEPPADFLEALAEESEAREIVERLRKAVRWGDDPVSPGEVRSALGASVLALESAPTAVYLGARFAVSGDFEAMMRFIIEMGGDVDTIGAMAGALFGALRGRAGLPPGQLEGLEALERIEAASRGLFEAAGA